MKVENQKKDLLHNDFLLFFWLIEKKNNVLFYVTDKNYIRNKDKKLGELGNHRYIK